MTLKQFMSEVFDYRIKDGDSGYDEMAQQLSNMGQWSITASPKKFEKVLLELCKRVSRLEEDAERRKP
jgi:hypothetical protein